jgi:hypothetical protein
MARARVGGGREVRMEGGVGEKVLFRASLIHIGLAHRVSGSPT